MAKKTPSQKTHSKPPGSASSKRESGVRTRRLLWILGGVVLFGGAVVLALDVTQPPPPRPPELDAVQTFPAMDATHLDPGAPLPVYNSDPPTSGPHDVTPAACGIYRTPVSELNYLHSMEHGAVVVQYDPALAQGEVERLEAIVRSIRGEILLAPRPNNSATVSLAAWTHLLLLDEVKEDVIRAFAREYSNRDAPEPGALCQFQVDQGR